MFDLVLRTMLRERHKFEQSLFVFYTNSPDNYLIQKPSRYFSNYYTVLEKILENLAKAQMGRLDVSNASVLFTEISNLIEGKHNVDFIYYVYHAFLRNFDFDVDSNSEKVLELCPRKIDRYLLEYFEVDWPESAAQNSEN